MENYFRIIYDKTFEGEFSQLKQIINRHPSISYVGITLGIIEENNSGIIGSYCVIN